MTTLPDLEPAGLTYGLKLIAEAIEAHFGERVEDYDEEAWNDTDDTSNHDAWTAFDALAARSVPEAGKAVDETLEPPISRMSADDGAPEWQQIVKLFERHRHPQPETRFRDELTTILAWARYGEKAAGAVR